MRQLFTFNYHILRTLHTKIGRVKYSDFEHPTFQGATAPTRDTQGVASLALGYVLHWAFSPSLLNPKPQGVASLALGLCAPLGLY